MMVVEHSKTLNVSVQLQNGPSYTDAISDCWK